MSLAEIKHAVIELSPEEIAELATFVREKEADVWDHQMDADFAKEGRLNAILEEVRADLRSGRVQELP